MNLIRKPLLLSSVATALCFSNAMMAQAEQLKVVTSFSILKDMVEQVAGDEAVVSSLVGRNGDTHFFSPSPSDAKLLKDSELLVINGLEFEGWITRLIEASGFEGMTVVATDGAVLLSNEEHDDHDDNDDHDEDEHHGEDEHHDADEHAGHDHHDHGEFDPHTWQSLSRGAVYVQNISAALQTARPEAADALASRAAAYIADLNALDTKLKAEFSAIDQHCRTIVTSHDAFQYFGADYGLNFVAPQGWSTASEASARDVASLIEQIDEGGIAGIFVENIVDARLVDQIASETGLGFGGVLYSGALSETDGPAATYLTMIEHNAEQILSALQAAEASGACEHHDDDDHDDDHG
ncbi:MAG: metal ABC transporter substrate-binding protein [Alphaproteobacteria bacterium TMED89]|nr:metal ABC transporter substrate-binding protein [Rhodospirillaceae bacterium]RPH13173.1 MAG: metal ABC transporter substrate-binding protein [Alphaproteobacteria bacterium TMED89]